MIYVGLVPDVEPLVLPGNNNAESIKLSKYKVLGM